MREASPRMALGLPIGVPLGVPTGLAARAPWVCAKPVLGGAWQPWRGAPARGGGLSGREEPPGRRAAARRGGGVLACAGIVVAARSSLRWRRCSARAADVATTRAPIAKGRVAPAQPVPPWIARPPYVAEPDKVRGWWNSQIQEKTPADLEAMRAAGRLARATLDRAEQLILPGVTTEEIDAELHRFMCEGGAYPSDLQYKGFPKSVMISVNEVICHGIPDDRPLRDGDIVNVDVTLYLNGFHADTARTWVCGIGDAAGHSLVAATREALEAAISVCRAGAPMRLIGDAVSAVAERGGYGVVKDLVGHGIGEFFHGVPQVYHCRNSDNRKMQEFTTFTIEPVFTEGLPEWITWSDGWTIATRDGGRTAQFEHTLVITGDGCEVLT